MVDKVTPAEAQELMKEEGYAYLDVRSIPEFEGGHPEGAYNIPLKHMGAGGMKDNETFLEEVEAVFDKGAKIIIGCKAGGRSKAAAERLSAAGYQNLKDQLAGYSGSRDTMGRLQEAGWASASLPIATEAKEGRDHASIASRTSK